ncbi:CvpA family protein [candidate division TA06 bacterium]|nr:CvpA family protein [candidate division TA06 bacterium]
MTVLGLSGADWIILALLAAFALLGFKKGLLREFFTLVGTFLSLLIAFLLMAPAGHIIGRLAPLTHRIQLILGFLSLFFLSLILLHLSFFFLSRVLRYTPIGFGDRLAGLSFGLLKGGFVVFVVLFFIGLLPLTSTVNRFFRTSFMMDKVRGVSPKIEKVISIIPKVKEVLDTKKGKLIIEKTEVEYPIRLTRTEKKN